MSLPVSQYEALLAEVRGLRRKAQRVQQLARPLIGEDIYSGISGTSARIPLRGPSSLSHQNDELSEPLDYTMESLLLSRQHERSSSPHFDRASSSCPEQLSSEDECLPRTGISIRSSTQMSVSSEPAARGSRDVTIDALYHGTWPTVDRASTLWNSEPASLGTAAVGQHVEARYQNDLQKNNNPGISVQTDASSVMSFASSSGGVPLDRVLGSPAGSKWSSQQLEAKMDVVHSLLSMLGSQEHVDMGETLLALSTCPESCLAMRQSGCIPLLVQLVQSDKDSDTRKKAAQALHNLVNSQPDEKIRKREVRILKLLEHTRAYIEALSTNTEMKFEASFSSGSSDDSDKHPVQTVAHLMKLSFDEGHRQAICQLGGIHSIASLVEAEHMVHGSVSMEHHCILMRRYACMALTNLTFGDSGNKALLCSFRDFMRALVLQLQSPSDELRQVTASVLRNLSWRADSTSKEILREVNSVTGLMKAAMLDNKENTLKSILSALWNLSAHCTENKSEICAVEGALGFLVTMLTYKTPSKSLAIIENAGGILRNISSQIAVREDYREVLRKHNCLQILLDQLKSPSLTIVSNACGTLWNLSAKSVVDQEALWEMGAPTMLRSLNHSKHKMIAMGSSAALKNLLTCRPQQAILTQMDSTALSLNLPELPTLGARKQKALLHDLDHTLSETCENLDKDSPIKSSGKSDGNTSTSDFIQNYSKMDDLNNAFSSLNINEPSTSYAVLKPRIPQLYGNSSLPYVPQQSKRSNPCAYIPVRAAFSDEADVSEQPIDYSRKFLENRSSSSAKKDVKSDESFNIAYAETDLDQPTDYSLRYAEDDSDSDICDKISKQEYVQDTVKTYCTEGTPYETPYVISNATSMSDLRNVGNVEEKPVIDNDIQKDIVPKVKEVKNIDEKDHCSTEDISELDNPDAKSEKLQYNSGLMSPEKPVNYCEEGTPGYFSRVSSFGSLNSIPPNESIKKESKEDESNQFASTEKKKQSKSHSESKAVKFEQVVNYAEETPLMFSRSSSLASLDSIEQHSIHDDRSSVVSDFSRLTSGIVSPSELPDSPTQTVPPSPKPRKTHIEFPSTSKSRLHSELKGQHQRTFNKPSVFEDRITKFKEESTPVQFSTATSLSSLTIDDHDHGGTESPSKALDTKVLQAHSDVKDELDSSNDDNREKEEQEKKDKEKETSGSDLNDDSGDDEDILAACINDGMQTSMQNPTASSTPSKLSLPSLRYQPNQSANTGIPMLRRHSPSRMIPPPMMMEESPKTYYTEDTPAQLSRTGSNSNLSALSIPNDSKSKKDYLSDDSSNLSGDNDNNILAECIQSAMPKSKKDLKVIPSLPQQISTSPQYHGKLASGLPRRAPMQPIKLNPASGGGGVAKLAPRKAEALKVHQQGIRERRDNSLPPYLTAGADELENYAVENSPCQFSLRSSLSDLTVDGSVAGVKLSARNQLQGETSGISNQKHTVAESTDPKDKHNVSQESNSNPLNRKESLSSLSLDSMGSIEGEQALLEQCIYSGMPTDKAEEALLKEVISAGMPKSGSSSSSNISKLKDMPDTRLPQTATNSSKSYQREHHERPSGGATKSKNGNVASVAGNTKSEEEVATQPLLPPTRELCPELSIAVAGVERDPGLGRNETGNGQFLDRAEGVAGELGRENEIKRGEEIDTSQDKYSPSGEICLTDLTKNGSNVSDNLLVTKFDNSFSENIDNCFAKSCEESGNLVDVRMLDPDAMIESLDRFTAELVSQASHLNKDKVSTNDSTWNDETSPNEVTCPSISGSAPNVITFDSDKDESNKVDGLNDEEMQQFHSNDFTSINTSTMTDSTLIAIEATKIATVFRQEAEMSQSITSAMSLELDLVRPPSQLNSLTNSAVGIEKTVPKSPKLGAIRKPLSSGLLIKRALSHSSNHASSLESLNNLDNFNPPSDMQNLTDLDNSITSVASLPNESDIKADFIINGELNKNTLDQKHNPIFDIKQKFLVSSFVGDLEFINPPSIFSEITDMCNSLADVPTEAIGTETEIYDDCVTHMAESTLQDEATEFSDANSITPIHTDMSSAESTPKKTKSLSKSMMTKQRRNMARDRYKTYTVAAEMVMREEDAKLRDSQAESESTTQEYKSAGNQSDLNVPYSGDPSKLTPKERRKLDKSRYDTQVVDEAVTSVLNTEPVTIEATTKGPPNSNSNSASPSPTRSKLSIRRNFIQKRLENRDRFRTQTLSESSFSPDISSASPSSDSNDLHFLVQKEANLVLKTLRDTNAAQDELLDCETLSLVSNDEDSEHNSGSSITYRTYHKSWGPRTNLPIISSEQSSHSNTNTGYENRENPPKSDVKPADTDVDIENEEVIPTKPKIVKPEEKQDSEINEPTKAIRGRRKPLYSPKTIKPAKTVTSNLVKNVTSTLKSAATIKNASNKTISPRPPMPQRTLKAPPSVTTSPVKTASNKNSPKNSPKGPASLERQGTFTKDDSPSGSPKTSAKNTPTPSRIPAFASKIARAVTTRIPTNNNTQTRNGTPKNGTVKSASTDRTNNIIKNARIYNRSTSADSREQPIKRIQPSSSTQSLRNEPKYQSGNVKKSCIPSPTQRSASSVSLTSTSAKKQVTSKIASLWKKVEESKTKQQINKDTRVWIQNEPQTEPPHLIRSNTFENKEGVILRKKTSDSGDTTKRVSRLGSFIVMNEDGESVSTIQNACVVESTMNIG